MYELQLLVVAGQIIVNMPQTRLTMTYMRAASDLVEEPLWTCDEGSNDFRTRARHAACHKAREIGWLD